MPALLVLGSVLAALLQTTWFAHALLVPTLLVALVLYIDVVPASVAALLAGTTLDVLGIHALGLPSSAVALLLVGAVELVRLSSRWADEHPGSVLLITVGFIGAAAHLLGGDITRPGALVGLLLSVGLHVAVILALLPALQATGDRYHTLQRERGMI